MCFRRFGGLDIDNKKEALRESSPGDHLTMNAYCFFASVSLHVVQVEWDIFLSQGVGPERVPIAKVFFLAQMWI
jgi:hypothetical protein